jgi:hypothetical protein
VITGLEQSDRYVVRKPLKNAPQDEVVEDETMPPNSQS